MELILGTNEKPKKESLIKIRFLALCNIAKFYHPRG